MTRMVWLVVLSALAIACHGREVRPKPPTAVRAEPISATNHATTTRYSGTILAQTQVDLAFKAGGYVASIATVDAAAPESGAAGPTAPPTTGARATRASRAAAAASAARDGEKRKGRPLQAGDRVTRDMVLASLRKADFAQKSAELSGMSAEATASYRKAKQDFDRASQLKETGSISQAEFDGTRARLDALGGTTAAAAARAGQAGLALSDSQLRSPLNGIVLDRRIEIGALVPPGAPVFVLADTSTVKIVFGVPDGVQRTLATGQAAVISAEALPERTMAGSITKIAAQADPKTRVFDVEATLDNADGLLKVGMIASVQLGRNHEGPGVLIPLSAVVRMPNDPQAFAVFTLSGEGANAVAKVRRVELGDLVGNRVAVSSGLAVGERIVTQGATLLQDGDAVNVVPGTQGTIIGASSVRSTAPPVPPPSAEPRK